MQELILLIHVFACITLIVLVLMQHGKGADVGAVLGSGASQTVFGSRGAASFIVRLTVAVAVVFFVTSLTLGYFASHQPGAMDRIETLAQKADNAASASLLTESSNLNVKSDEKKRKLIPER